MTNLCVTIPQEVMRTEFRPLNFSAGIVRLRLNQEGILNLPVEQKNTGFSSLFVTIKRDGFVDSGFNYCF